VSEHPLTTLPTGPPGISVIEGLSTVEVRWIRPGQLDAAIAGWFRRFPAETDLFRSKVFESGVTGQMLQQIALGGTMIVLPIYLQMLLEYNALQAGLSLAPLSLGFTNLATASTVFSPAGQQQVAHALETDAQILSSTQLEQQLANHPETIQNEIIRINTDARPLALQIALLIPVLAGGLGLFNSFRMMRLPDPLPSGIAEGAALG
jgi:hypothetical protein